MKTLVVCPVALLALFCAASAQLGLPSSKATADINTLVKCNMTAVGEPVKMPASCVNLFTGEAEPVDANGFVEIASKKMKLSASQSLFVSPPLVTGLYTRTRTKTSTGSTSTDQTMGGICLRAAVFPSVGQGTSTLVIKAAVASGASVIAGTAEPRLAQQLSGWAPERRKRSGWSMTSRSD